MLVKIRKIPCRSEQMGSSRVCNGSVASHCLHEHRMQCDGDTTHVQRCTFNSYLESCDRRSIMREKKLIAGLTDCHPSFVSFWQPSCVNSSSLDPKQHTHAHIYTHTDTHRHTLITPNATRSVNSCSVAVAAIEGIS
jgi:hypothetical protein